jgi:hypothetical protein
MEKYLDMLKIYDCPYCHKNGNDVVYLSIKNNYSSVHCDNCGADGPSMRLHSDAIIYWNAVAALSMRNAVTVPQQPQAGSEASPKPCANCQYGPLDNCGRLCIHNVTYIDHFIPRTASAVR